MNDYKSTVLQTKKALDLKDNSVLNNTSDIFLLEDALDGIKAAINYGFTAEGIIAINKSFVHSEKEDPKFPGHLRTSKFYNPEDKIVVITDPNGTTKNAYYAPDDVFIEDIENIINAFNASNKTNNDAWRVFARIAKLQPFQDGNKRTALIAANAAKNTWSNQDYLVLPFNNQNHSDFMINLMKYYNASNDKEENMLLDNMFDLIPTPEQIQLYLSHLEDSSKT
ncbi:MAG: Fic family protein [Bacteroides sp.]|nr:Fic family protein [Bacteroides sp.]